METAAETIATPKPVQSTGRIVGTAAASLMAILTVIQLWQYGLRMPGIDFYQFWVVGRELRMGDVDQVYSPATRSSLGTRWLERASADRASRLYAAAKRRETLETFSTPWLYSAFALLSTGDYERDYRCYVALSMAISIASIVALGKVFRMSTMLTCLWIAFVFGCFQPMRSDVAVANVNQLQFGGLALYVWIQSRSTQLAWTSRLRLILGGFILGMMVAFKPNLGIAVGLLMLSWFSALRWSRLAWQGVGFSVAMATAIGVSSAVFGTYHCWSEWFQSLGELMGGQDFPLEIGNFSLAALLKHVGLQRLSMGTAAAVATAAAIVVVACSIRRRDVSDTVQAQHDLLIIGIGTIAMLLGSRLAWLHYFDLLLPVAIFCLASTLQGGFLSTRWIDRLMTIGSVILVALMPIKWVVGFQSFTVPVTLCLIGTLLLAIQVIREIRQLPGRSERGERWASAH
jgi:hypothetical protein